MVDVLSALIPSIFVIAVANNNNTATNGVFSFTPTQNLTYVQVYYQNLSVCNQTVNYTPSTQNLTATQVVSITISGCSGNVILSIGSNNQTAVCNQPVYSLVPTNNTNISASL
jgi:hypothetical protein